MGPLSDPGGWFNVEATSDIGRVRRVAMRLADQLAFDESRAAEVGIVATELSTNLQRHAAGGIVSVYPRRSGADAAVELLAIDRGPGIADVGRAMTDGMSSSGTLGIGLGAVRRLSSWFDVHSVRGRGTIMFAALWRDRQPSRPAHCTLTRAMSGEDVCGDSCGVRTDGSIDTFVVADGLGHGPLAQAASFEAMEALAAVRPEGAGSVLESMHRRLRSTRGAAVAVAQFSRKEATLSFAGAGNVAAWICSFERRRALLSTPGIVGHNVRRFNVDRVEVPPDSLLVMHSDGLTDKWSLEDGAGLLTRSPEVIAATLMRDAATRNDDASVLVARLS